MKISLGKITDITLLTLTVLVIGLIVKDQFLPKTHPTAKALIGKRWESNPVQNNNDSRDTLLLVLSTTCPRCDESMEFYQRLLASRKNKLGVIAIFPQTEVEGREHLNQYAIKVDRVISSRNLKGLWGTPTLLLLSPDQTVKSAWEGRLDSTKEKEVLEAIKLIGN
jgi:hypothetical protein